MDNPRKTSLNLSLISIVLVLPLHSQRLQAQNSLTNGLVAYWNFDKQGFNDSIGKFDGTGHGEAPISFIPGKPGFGQAIQLNGVDQFVEITGRDSTYKANDLAMAGGSISIAGWFTVDSFDKSWQALVAKGRLYSWRIQRYDASLALSYAGGDPEGPNDGPDVNDGNWHHFTAVSDAQAVNFGACLYIDGVQTSVNHEKPELGAEDGRNMTIGDNPVDTGRYWHGKVDDLAIWNRVLTETEIKSLYAGGTGQPLSAFVSTQTPPAELTITRSGNDLSIQWSPGGGTLEFRPLLGSAAAWTTFGTANPALIRIQPDGGFYRVRQ